MSTGESKKELKIGIIGLGVGEKHVEAYKSHKCCEVVCVCDFSEEVLTSFRSKHPTIKTVKSADDVFSDKDIDLVSIASYDNYHYEQTIKALENQKHVFVEKPLCLLKKEALTIKKLLKKNSFLMLSSNLNLRTCPRFKNLKALIQSGEMGEVFYFEGDYLWGRIRKLTNGWRGKMPFYSVVYGAAVHIIDLLIWLVEKKPVEVKGYGSRIATSGSGFDYMDFATLLLRFDDGMLAKVSANGGCVHPHFHRVAVYGTKQTFLNESKGGQLIRSREPSVQAEDLSDGYPGKDKNMVIHSFVDSIINNDVRAAIVPSDDVFDVMSICFAAEESIQNNKTVSIDYI